MRKLLSMITMLSLFLFGQAFAQNKTVSGKVTNKEDGTPIPGATVKVKGGTVGTQTDIEGNYKLELPADTKQLEVSFIGMLTVVLDIAGRSDINIALAAEDTQLSEVVVVGYAVQEKREATGAISSVKGSVIENLPVQSFDRALQGRAAGVLVQSANGLPGGAVSVRIRGVGSITAGNEPLYIVDGVQMNNTNNASFSSNNPLSFLNPNDIESMDIIKDAAAAAIYGAQAANGVVLITTKKGKSGNTKFNFNYYKGVNEPMQNLRMLNTQQFLQARYEAVQNRNATADAATVWASVLGSVRLDPSLTEAQRAALPTYDWQKEAFKLGAIDNYELTLSGGNDKTTFYLSGSYMQQDATVRNVDFNRFTTRLNVTHKVNDKLTIENSINLSSSWQKGTFGGPNGGAFLGSPVFSAPLVLPMNPIYNEDGSFYGTPASGGLAGILNQNIIMNSEYNIIKNTNNQAVGNMSATYKVAKGLLFKAYAGVDFRYLKGSYFADPRTADGQVNLGRVSEQSEQNINFITNYTLNYDNTFNKVHHVSALAGVEYRSDIRDGINLEGVGVPTSQFSTANSVATPSSVGGLWTGFKRTGVFGNLKYAYNKKYLASFILRYDGSSRFGSDNLYGLFPSVSVGWVVSEESFLKPIKMIDQLKLRASYGQTGNDQIDNFASRGLYGPSTGFPYGGVSGMIPISLVNPSLRWEKNVTIDLGLDYSLFGGRVSGAFDIYERTSSDLLLDKALPQTSGYSSITSNIGEVVNRGFEAEISTVNVKYRDFTWKSTFNIALVSNKVTKLNGADTVLPGNQSVRLNQALEANYQFRYAGVNPAIGRAMWYDRNGNITYLPLDPADRVVIGNDFATTTGGLRNTFSYKGLELDVFFQYEYGRQALNSQNSFMSENGGRLFNSLADIYERRWVKPGQITDVPRPFDGRTETRSISYNSGSRFFEDASYIRLKQVSLSYMLPSNWVSKVKLSTVRVYATALNLLTFTKWGGVDPEFVSLANPGSTTRNGNTGVAPQTRSYTLGIQIGF